MGGRFLSLLAEGPRLIVSLPANSPELARAAVEGGAEALKVHLHVRHDASGMQFGNLAEERANLEQILALGLPTGIVPGAGDHLPTPEEMQALAEMGVDFFDLYVHDTPAWLVRFAGMTRAVAISGAAQCDELGDLEAMGFELLEAALVPHEGYGKPLSVADLVAYRQVRRATGLPIIVPTQRAIRPEEAPILLRETGINALMIGAIVTGREAASLRAATERFAAAMRS
jgi:putative N-acetylmannosamine-6-phosphate epimerase